MKMRMVMMKMMKLLRNRPHTLSDLKNNDGREQ